MPDHANCSNWLYKFEQTHIIYSGAINRHNNINRVAVQAYSLTWLGGSARALYPDDLGSDLIVDIFFRLNKSPFRPESNEYRDFLLR